MKLLLILVGFFACMSVERVGYRKWSFVFRPGILFLIVMVALVLAGCDLSRDSVVVDKNTGCEWRIELPKDRPRSQALRVWMTPSMGADGKQICRKAAP